MLIISLESRCHVSRCLPMLYDISLWKLRQRLHYVYWNDVIVMIYAPNFDYVAYIAVRHDMIWLRNLRRSLKNWPAAGQDIDAQIPLPIKWKNKLRLVGINECSTNWEMQPIRTFNIAFCIICILLSERDYVTFGSLLSQILSLIHIWRCRRIERCRSRWSPYH